MRKAIFLSFLLSPFWILNGQLLEDDFDGRSTISSWYGDDCLIDTSFANPYPDASNPSSGVLKYEDIGGVFANIGFDAPEPIHITPDHPFRLKIYVPSEHLSGQQPNQISLKLQNNQLPQPWITQTEIIKPIVLDQWQEVEFDFVADPFINLDPNSADPIDRSDFNRVLLQVNGENNTDEVVAYIDDFFFEGEPNNGGDDPVYDQLVWQDEFEQEGALDSSKWFHQTELPLGDSWFNGEIQHYTDRTANSYAENGRLHLVAKKETFTDQGVTKEYTSARLNSKFAFTYGRIEVKAKLPVGGGTWPAIWMLNKNINERGAYWYEQGFGTTDWPDCGEIDIMEHWGWNQNFVQSAIHTRSSFGGTVNKGGRQLSTASTDFHVYAMDWYPDRLVFSIDGVEHYSYTPQEQNPDTWPFVEDQYLLLNIAIEPTIDPNFSESALEVDYVRVYQERTTSSPQRMDKPKLILSPNPTTHQLIIQSPAEALGSPVFIFDTQGRLVRSLKIGSRRTTVDVSSWLAGMYFLQQGEEGHKQTFTLIKK